MFNSAVSIYYAPSDLSGIGGMRREWIRAVPSWRRGAARNDCIFVQKDENDPGFRGLHAAQVLIFFSFGHDGIDYPCALVRWFIPIGDEPCPDTGMWMVEPEFIDGEPVCSVIHLDCIYRGAHLIPVYGKYFIPRDLKFSDSLHAFRSYYVNKYADHHAHEIAF